MDIMDLFPDRVIPEPNSGCWLWAGAVASHGYGTVRKNETTHRLSCEISCGEIPAGMLVLHKCDNKLCVNPDHLYVGTKSDNGMDAYARGRLGRQVRRRRTAHPASLLSEEQISEIRALPAGRFKRGANVIPDMAKRFGVSAAAIYDVRLGRSWAV